MRQNPALCLYFLPQDFKMSFGEFLMIIKSTIDRVRINLRNIGFKHVDYHLSILRVVFVPDIVERLPCSG